MPGGLVLASDAAGAKPNAPPERSPNDTAVMAFASVAAVDPKTVPEPLRAWQGRTLRVLGGAAPCTTRIRDFGLLSLVDGHPLQAEVETNGSEPPAEGDPPIQPMIAEMWQSSPPMLVGRFETPCPDGTWAIEAELPEPKPGTVRPLEPEDPLAAKALAQIRRHRSYRKAQAEYVAEEGLIADHPDTPRWDFRSVVTRIDGAAPSLVVATVYTPVDCCSPFNGALTFFFELSAKSALVEVPTFGDTFQPQEAVAVGEAWYLLGVPVAQLGPRETVIYRREARGFAPVSWTSVTGMRDYCGTGE